MMPYSPSPSNIRNAAITDCRGLLSCVQRSIIDLCEKDHNKNPDIISGWALKKDADWFRALLCDPTRICAVLMFHKDIACVGVYSTNGQIEMLYVDPTYRFRGASSSLLLHMERSLGDLGLDRVTLTSTKTAKEFYMDKGYLLAGEPVHWRGNTFVHPMMKQLSMT